MKEKTKDFSYWIHMAITIVIMVGFGYLPAPEPVTPFGMQVLGIFIGMVYGWSMVDQIWPSLFGIIMLAVVDYDTIGNLLIAGWGSGTVWTIVMVLVFAQAVSDAGVTEYLAIKLINHKVFFGRPWLFTGVIIFVSFFLSAITGNPFVAMIIMWRITYDICSFVGYKPKDAWPSLTLVGITFSATIGMGAFPHQLIPLIVFGAYESMGGPSINYGSYVAVCWGSMIFIVLLYLLVNKYILRLNVEKIAHIDGVAFADKVLTLNRQQKIIFTIFILMIVSFFACNMLPKSWGLIQLLNKLKLPGLAALFVGIAMIIKVEGKPLLDFQEAASKGVLWPVVVLTAAALPISSALTSEGTGVQEFLINILGPLFAGKPVILFGVLALVLALIITNFANNTVTALVFMAVVVNVAAQVGANATAIVVLLVVIVHIAVLTPAACPTAGMLFANNEWITPSFIYKEAIALIIIASLVVCSYGYFVANLLF